MVLPMNRREFMHWAGAGFLASSLPVALAAHSMPTDTTPSTSSTPISSNEGFTAIADLADLRPNESLEVTIGPNKKLIAITGDIEKPESIIAVDPTCTHMGCTVKWNSQSKDYVCPCHRSKFSESGAVVNGPASQPLLTYEVKVESGKILVRAQQ